jgi:ArsR family transcriptional regulator
MSHAPLDLAAFEDNATVVAKMLKALANERRLMILCTLSAEREVSVNALAETVGLSQSALSQHLAKLREEGIVTFRRHGQMLWYRIADPRVGKLMKQLEKLFCPSR